jgi:hypothetical protein
MSTLFAVRIEQEDERKRGIVVFKKKEFSLSPVLLFDLRGWLSLIELHR